MSVLVIGAGPAGMMAAGNAALCGMKVTIVEKNPRVGRKLLITGKGRCNITNNCTNEEFIANVPTNARFLYSAVNHFSPQDTISFFEQNNLPVKTERGKRVFPKSDKAMDVVDTMHSFVKSSGCKIVQDEIEGLLIEDGKVTAALGKSKKQYKASRVIIACGGKSYPLTGSTGQGYALARQAGHTIVTPKPSLISLVCENSFCEEMQGLSLRNIALTVTDNEEQKEIYNDFGEMLFTHYGVSGPVVLSASAHMPKISCGKYTLNIDLKPGLTAQQLDKRMVRDFTEFKNRSLANTLLKLLPSSMVPVIINRAGIAPEIKCHSITKESRAKLAQLIKSFSINVHGFRPLDEAVVTSGGVQTKEINPKTMESKLVKGLYFAGEVIDVDGYTGGFNLQIAFSTGYLAGISAAQFE